MFVAFYIKRSSPLISAGLLEAFGLKAVIVRPCLEGWNEISYTMTLEQMLESIGEPVKNWRRKKNRQ